MKYEVIYTRKKTSVIEAENSFDLRDKAQSVCPDGFEFTDSFSIDDNEHLNQVLLEVKAQELLS